MTLTSHPARRHRAAVLLEVILALVLFVAAAAVVTGALNSSLAAVERQKASLHAANLAVSVLSELNIGARMPESGGAVPFLPPFENWSSEIIFASSETSESGSSGLARVEVVIRGKEPPMVYRIGQVINLSNSKGTNLANVAAP